MTTADATHELLRARADTLPLRIHAAIQHDPYRFLLLLRAIDDMAAALEISQQQVIDGIDATTLASR